MPPEAKLRRDCKKLFEAQGWLVFSLSSHKKMPKGTVGMPDQIVVAPDTTFFIEYKSPNGQPEDSQVDIWLKMRPFLGKYVRWVWCSDKRQIEDVIEVWLEDQKYAKSDD